MTRRILVIWSLGFVCPWILGSVFAQQPTPPPEPPDFVPEGWLPAVKYLVEELGADVNARDHNGYSPVHHAAARGDNELIRYLVEQGADVMAVSRRGQTTVDMANGPQQRVRPFPETIQLLESLGAINNHDCRSC